MCRNAGSRATTYAHTGDNNLLGEDDGTTATEYVLDTQGGLVERLGAATTVSSTTTSAWYVRGWGGELARQTSGGTAWYLADRLGSVRAEYGSAGTVGARTDYDPFGVPEAGTGLTTPTDYGFADESQDNDAGLVQLCGHTKVRRAS